MQFGAWAALVAALTASDGGVPVSSVEITVTGLHSQQGSLRLALFSSSAGWPENDQKALRRVELRIVDGQARAHFEGLAPGTYAAVAFHDEDADGKLDKNFLGLPTEGWGATNQARSPLGPRWESARFTLADKRALTISIQY